CDDFNVRDKVTDFARRDAIHFLHLGRQYPDAVDLVHLAVRHQPDLHPFMHLAVDDTNQHEHTAVDVEPGIKQQRLERSVGISLRWRDAFDDPFEYVFDAFAVFRADHESVFGIHPDYRMQLLLNTRDLGAGEIDFVDDRQDLEVMIQG